MVERVAGASGRVVLPAARPAVLPAGVPAPSWLDGLTAEELDALVPPAEPPPAALPPGLVPGERPLPEAPPGPGALLRLVEACRDLDPTFGGVLDPDRPVPAGAPTAPTAPTPGAPGGPGVRGVAARLDLIVALDRQAAWLAALRAHLLAGLAPLDAEGRPLTGDDGPLDGEDWVREELAAATRTSPVTAHHALTAARHLVRRLPATLAALTTGDLDPTRARAVADLTADLPGGAARRVEARVLPRAARQTLPAVKAALRRAVAAVDPHGAADRAAAARAGRTVTREPLPDAMTALHVVLPALDAALVYDHLDACAALTPRTDPARTDPARTAGRDEQRDEQRDERSAGARRADALVALVRAARGDTDDRDTDHRDTGPSPGAPTRSTPVGGPPATGSPAADGPPVTGATPGGATPTGGARTGATARRTPPRPVLQVVIDLPDLLGLRDEPATLVGHGPLPAPLARALAADTDWQRLVRDPLTGHLLDLGRARYRPSRPLLAHVQARDRRCRFPGCRRQASRSHLDHTVPWPTGPTDRGNLHVLCTRHHRLKHRAGWTVTLHPDTSTTWTSPTGTRHHLPPPPAHPDD